MSNLKQTFIIRCLQNYNEEVTEGMRRAMRDLDVEETGAGYNSFAHKILQSGAGAYSELSFKQYLRFVDMGVGRGQPIGSGQLIGKKLRSNKQKAIEAMRGKGRKRKQIYSKIAYGKLPYLTGKLLYGYTTEAIEEIKKELQIT